MSKSPHVVDGEASESDSDVEIGKSPDTSPSSKAFVISGEAPESDDESKLPSPISDEQDAPLHTMFESPSSPSSPTQRMHNSLLHQKLWECNVSLRATVEGLARHTTDICVEKLTRADKTLLSVQVRSMFKAVVSLYGAWARIMNKERSLRSRKLQESMRATNASLSLARARLKQLHAALERANCSAALPTVRVK